MAGDFGNSGCGSVVGNNGMLVGNDIVVGDGCWGCYWDFR